MECKFFSRCEYADEKSFMCTKKGGGSYCGKYRALCTESVSGTQPSAHNQSMSYPDKL